MASKEKVVLKDKTEIFIFSPGYFMATKLAAFKNRAPADIRQSQDLEDIFAVFDGCSRIEQSHLDVSEEARKYPDLQIAV